MMNKWKIIIIVMLLVILASCSPSKSKVLEKLVAKEEGYSMHIFSNSSDFDMEVNEVYNSDNFLQYSIQEEIQLHPVDETIHPEDEKLKWLKKLDITDDPPVILIFDSEELVFHTKDPQELRDFSQVIDD